MEVKCKLCGDGVDALSSAGLLIAPEWDRIKNIGRAAIPELLNAFKDKDREWKLRYFISSIICDILGRDKNRVIRYGYKGVPYFYINKDDRVVKVAIEIAKDKTDNRKVRKEAVDILGAIGDKKAVEPLIELLKNERKEKEYGLVHRVILALENLKDTRAVEPLKEYVMRHYGDKDLAPALYALCELGEGSWVYDIVMKMREDRCRVRFLLSVLGSTNDKRAVKPLIDSLKAGNFWAAEALGRLWEGGIHDDRIIEALIEGLKYEKDELVGVRSAKVLGKIKDKRAIKPLKEALLYAKDRYFKEVIISTLKTLTGRDYRY
jgi:HEAT repeat protein